MSFNICCFKLVRERVNYVKHVSICTTQQLEKETKPTVVVPPPRRKKALTKPSNNGDHVAVAPSHAAVAPPRRKKKQRLSVPENIKPPQVDSVPLSPIVLDLSPHFVALWQEKPISKAPLVLQVGLHHSMCYWK